MSAVRPEPEESIQESVMAHLSLLGWNVYQFAPPRTHQRLGGVLPDGWPDLLCIKDGRYVHLEVKSERGKLRLSQELRIADLREAGAVVAVVRSVAEAEAAVRGWHESRPGCL